MIALIPSRMKQATVIVPATTANLGAGFDCIGAALTLYNQFTFTTVETNTDLKIVVTGEAAARVSQERDNLLYQSFTKFYQKIDRSIPKIEVEIKLGVPLARGLGSSATAIVGGLVGANQLAGNPLSTTEVMELAIEMEGHPDNVVPALLGNCQLSVGETGNWQICEIPWHQEIVPVVAIPDFELSTEEARSVLPTTISRSDAIFNISRLGLLLRGLETNRSDWLSTALADKLHQPYRQSLIHGYQQVQSAAIASGAYGMVISGAGPTLLALTNPQQAKNVVRAMMEAWGEQGINPKVMILQLDTTGAKVI
ncbi:MAG: homoserine kinase [Stanieria sp.]